MTARRIHGLPALHHPLPPRCLEAPTLTCLADASGLQRTDEEDSSSEGQEPTTPGREERSPSTPPRPGRLGKRANSSKDASYEWLYEETNALLKNLHFQRLKRVAGDRDVQNAESQ